MDKKEGEKTSSSAKDAAAAKKLLLESLVKKADYYHTKGSITDNDLYYLVKDFFREFLDLKYEFSFEELLLEVDKTYMETEYREKTIAFVKKIEHIEYSNTSLSESELNSLINDFCSLSKGLLNMAEPKKVSFWGKFKGSFGKKQKSDAYNSPTTKSAKQNAAPAVKKIEAAQQTVSPSLQSASSEDVNDACNQLLDVLADDDFSSEKEKLPAEDNDSLTEMKEKYNDAAARTAKNSPAPNILSAGKSYSKNKIGADGKKYYSVESDVYTKYYNTNAAKNSLDETKSRSNEKKTTQIQDWTTPVDAASFKSEPKAQVKKASQQTKTLAKSSVPSKDGGKSTSKKSIDDMIAQAKKTKNKAELIALYKKIHSVYEKGDIDMQTAYYQDIMDIYKNISKLK
jgi:hypothetical protein